MCQWFAQSSNRERYYHILTLLGWNLKELTLPAWPVYCNSAWPECMPHMIAEWSADAVPRMGRRILETETSQIPSLWPVYLLKGVQLSKAGGPGIVFLTFYKFLAHYLTSFLLTFEVGHDLVGVLLQLIGMRSQLMSIKSSGHFVGR